MRIHQCQCRDCMGNGDQATKLYHSRLNLVLSRLNEQQRRWVVYLETYEMDYHGWGKWARMAFFAGMREKDVSRGCRELCAMKHVGRWVKPGSLNKLLGHLNERQRRWLVGLKSLTFGHGGDRHLSLITGMNVETIRRGRREVEAGLVDCPPERIRKPGGGRRRKKAETEWMDEVGCLCLPAPAVGFDDLHDSCRRGR